MYKVIILGNSNVGKSSLFNSIVRGVGESNGPSVDCTFAVVYVDVVGPDGKQQTVRIDLWDTSGQERFLAITQNYYRDVYAAIFVYDVTNRTSLRRLKFWQSHLSTEGNTDFVPILVGNKIDLTKSRDPCAAQATQFAASIHCPLYATVSALTGEGVADFLRQLALQLLTQGEPAPLAEPDLDVEAPPQSTLCRCQ